VDAYAKPDRSQEKRIDATIKRLEKDVASSVSARSGIVTLTARAESAVLSQQIVNRLLQLLNQFNLDRRRSQASEERRFAEARVQEVRAELRTAENRLQYFLQANRNFTNSPSLRFQEERLSADVALHRQLYTTLVQAYEQAKIDEVRDTPVITVVETPEVPVRPDSRGLLLRALGGLVAGMLLGMVLATIRAVTQTSRVRRSEEFDAFESLKHEAIADLKHPWRPLMRAFRGERRALPT
jgi:tyrosine-protein kinase Etk/Wzc